MRSPTKKKGSRKSTAAAETTQAQGKRVIVYWFAPATMRDTPLANMRERVERFAAEGGMELIDIIVDCGPPKDHPSDYPVLARLERGEADLLLLGRSDLLQRSGEVDLLESKCRPEPMAFYTVDELRQLELIPVLPRQGANSEPQHSSTP